MEYALKKGTLTRIRKTKEEADILIAEGYELVSGPEEEKPKKKSKVKND